MGMRIGLHRILHGYVSEVYALVPGDLERSGVKVQGVHHPLGVTHREIGL